MSDNQPQQHPWAAFFAKTEQADTLQWGRSPLRFAVADTVLSLLDRGLIEHWLRYGNLRYPQLTVSYGGVPAPPTGFTRTRQVGQHQLTGCAHADDVIEHLDRGATLVLSNPEMWDENIARFCADLAGPLSATVKTFVYLTAPSQYGSRPHRDEPDVFVVQVAGSKNWTLYDVPVDDEWSRGEIRETTPATQQIVLRAGDGLYVPAGMGHRAAAGPDGSLHMSVAVTTPRLRTVVERWAAQAAAAFGGQERFGPGAAGRVAAVRQVLAWLANTLDGTDPAALADAVLPTGAPATPRHLSWPT